jgi:ABC-2 type transport system permease protein
MFFVLIRLNIRALLASFFQKMTRSKKKKSVFTSILLVLLGIYVAGAMVLMFAGLFSTLAEPFHDMDVSWLYFGSMGMVSIAFNFIGTVFLTQKQVFEAKDNDLLLSLPLSPSSVLLGRISTLLLLDYFYQLFIAIPAMAIWIMHGYASASGIVIFILMLLLIPLLSMTLSLLIGWLVSLITMRMRSKNIITMVLTLGFLGVYFYAVSNFEKVLTGLIEQGDELAQAFQTGLPPIYWLGDAVANSNFLSAVFFALCCTLPFALSVFILNKFFILIATTNRGAKKIVYHQTKLREAGIRKTLLLKELKHFLSNPMLIMNMALSSLIAIIAGIVLLIRPSILSSTLAQFTMVLPNLTSAGACTIILAFLACVNTAGAALVSLEGKQLWIVKSLPVAPQDVLFSKVEMHVVICGLPVLFASLCAAIAMGGSFADIALLLFFPFLISIIIGLVGVTLNLLIPRFDWINEVQPAKQGIPVLLTMFGSMSLLVVIAIGYFLLAKVLSLNVYLLLASLLMIVIGLLLALYLKTAGSRRFDTIQA